MTSYYGYEIRLTCGQTPVSIQPGNLLFYLWMLERCKAGLSPVVRTEMSDDNLTRALLKTYRRLHGCSGKAYPQNWVDERKPHVSKVLSQALGKQGSQPYAIQACGKRPRPVEAIELGRGAVC